MSDYRVVPLWGADTEAATAYTVVDEQGQTAGPEFAGWRQAQDWLDKALAPVLLIWATAKIQVKSREPLFDPFVDDEEKESG